MRNIIEVGRPHGACALHAGYLRLHTHTHRACNIYCFSAAATFVRTRLNVTLHVEYIACLGNS